LRAKGFKVFVCLNHFTHPLWVHNPLVVLATRLRQRPKGWLEENTIIEFVKVCRLHGMEFRGLGGLFGNPKRADAVCEVGYMMAQSGFPPGVNSFMAAKRAQKTWFWRMPTLMRR